MEEIKEELVSIVENTEYADYQEFKTKFDEEWNNNEKKAAELVEGFARIGYLLKLARDTDILKDSEYQNYIDFARAEYDIDKTVVSSYIRINDRFSEGGNSEILQERYRNFGYAKLRLMLQLPDVINNELTPEYSKAEIQAIKEEYEEEQKTSDIEVILEGQKPEQYSLSNLSKALHQLCENVPEIYLQLYEKSAGSEKTEKAIYEVLAPDEEKMYSIPIKGVGRLMMTVKAEQISIVNMREEQTEIYSWSDVMNALEELIDVNIPAKQSWEEKYGKTFPEEKAKVAPVQQKSAKRKESKVVKTKAQPKNETVSEKNETELQENETVSDKTEQKEEPVQQSQTEEIKQEENTSEADAKEKLIESEAVPVEMENENAPASDETEVQPDPETNGTDSEIQMHGRKNQQELLEKRREEVKRNILIMLEETKEDVRLEHWNTFKMHLADMKADAERIEKIDAEIKELNDTSQIRVEDFIDGEEKEE